MIRDINCGPPLVSIIESQHMTHCAHCCLYFILYILHTACILLIVISKPRNDDFLFDRPFKEAILKRAWFIYNKMIFLPIIFLGGIKAATITSPPQDATTLFGDTAVFNCTGEGDLLQWTYDGTTVDGQIAQQHQISIVDHNVSDGMVSSSIIY